MTYLNSASLFHCFTPPLPHPFIPFHSTPYFYKAMFTGKDIPIEKRWYVVGAHQAGASERQCARLSGLSKTAVHGIIKSFTETGSPLSCRQQQSLHPSGKLLKGFINEFALGRPVDTVQSLISRAMTKITGTMETNAIVLFYHFCSKTKAFIGVSLRFNRSSSTIIRRL